MKFNPGFEITPTQKPFGFTYGDQTFGPEVEIRTLDEMRKNLLDPNCDGPEEVYAIAMDVGNKKDYQQILERNLLYGCVTYTSGRLGKEPIRSQGHIHAVSQSCGESTPEVYEIWQGEAYIYMQESAKDNPGRCFAIHAKAGDVVIVPPYWAHATISANPNEPLTFGAWCVRDFGFDYVDVRAHRGLAYYPILKDDNTIEWMSNDAYEKSVLEVRKPRIYDDFAIEEDSSIYTQFQKDPDRFLFVSDPMSQKEKWEGFKP